MRLEEGCLTHFCMYEIKSLTLHSRELTVLLHGFTKNASMNIRYEKETKIVDVVITALAGVFSVGIMLYGVGYLGIREAWPELVLNVFYIACLLMIWMYIFNRLDTQKFNYLCSVCVGITVLLRDILFPPPLANYPLHLVCLNYQCYFLSCSPSSLLEKNGSHTPSVTYG